MEEFHNPQRKKGTLCLQQSTVYVSRASQTKRKRQVFDVLFAFCWNFIYIDIIIIDGELVAFNGPDATIKKKKTPSNLRIKDVCGMFFFHLIFFFFFFDKDYN